MDILYKATATSTGGREGSSTSSDGKLKLKLSTPKELGGSGGEGTNPEQLFAAGYSACFHSALKFVAGLQKQALPSTSAVTAEVGIGKTATGFALEVELRVDLPDVDRDIAQMLIDKAHIVCPYSNATRGNITSRTVLL
jgi:osmotically inducible protein OsmC